MKRKVIKQGGQAYTITLPIEWVRENGISEKSEIEVESVEKSLVLNSSNAHQGGSAHFSIGEWSSRNIYVHLVALYARGIDEIVIESEKDISASVTKALANLIGFALVHQHGTKYTIREIGGGAYPDLDEIFKRVFQMILLFYESAITDIFGAQSETLESLKGRDTEVNKFCLYLQRAINKKSYNDIVNGRILFTYSYALEKISDEIERLWRTNIKSPLKKNHVLHDVAIRSKETLAKAFDLYYQYNSRFVEEIYHMREDVREMSLKLPRPDLITARFVRHLVKIAEDAADLNHLALMRKD